MVRTQRGRVPAGLLSDGSFDRHHHAIAGAASATASANGSVAGPVASKKAALAATKTTMHDEPLQPQHQSHSSDAFTQSQPLMGDQLVGSLTRYFGRADFTLLPHDDAANPTGAILRKADEGGVLSKNARASAAPATGAATVTRAPPSQSSLKRTGDPADDFAAWIDEAYAEVLEGGNANAARL